MPDATFESGETVFPAQARLTVFSDGVTEAENINGVSYESSGVANSLAHIISTTTAEEIGQMLLADLDRFRIGAPAKDDTTLLVVGLY
jgi:serine phosphatase RsbU (regulator of sigma subunit)